MGAYRIAKQGDTFPPIDFQLRHDPPFGVTDGAPVDLSTASQVAVVFQSETTKTVIHAAEATITDPLNGYVRTPLAAEISAHPGLVSFEWVVTWNDGTQTTYPSTVRARNNYLLIRRELAMPDSIPAPQLATGDPQEIAVTAAETISAFRVVAQGPTGAVLFDPTDDDGLDVFGVAKTAAASAGDQVLVVTDGIVGGAVGLVPGDTYWAGPGGALTNIEPTTGLLVAIGYAATATEFVVQVGEPIELA